MSEISALDSSTDETAVSAVSILIPPDVSGFRVYTILVAKEKRHLIGYDEENGGWDVIWDDSQARTYETVSEQWMKEQYGDRIERDERVDFEESL